MSLTSPIFLLSLPMTSVPLNFEARNWSGFCDVTKSALPDELDGAVAAGGLAPGLGLVGEVDCAIAPVAISAPIAVPIISLLIISMPPCSRDGTCGCSSSGNLPPIAPTRRRDPSFRQSRRFGREHGPPHLQHWPCQRHEG